jgi:hypothetical protein
LGFLDCFALFDEPRRPWLSPDALKEKFLKLSSEDHPDRVHGAPEAERRRAHERYAELNTAYQTLREPRDRLRHLLELERGAKPGDIEQIPSGSMDLFFEIAKTIRDTDAFLAEKNQISSPLLQVRLFEQGTEWTERLMKLQRKIDVTREALALELDALNRFWECAPPPGSPERLEGLPLDRLEQVYRLFSYISRWTAQIQERIVQLSF